MSLFVPCYQVMKGGQARLHLKCADHAEATNWEQHIYQRLDWLHEEKELQEEADRYDEEMALENNSARKTGPADREPVQVSGWLKKKSPKKYAGLQVRRQRLCCAMLCILRADADAFCTMFLNAQDRFVKVENNYLHYFKTEADAKNVSTALGGVSLETVDWVRPYDSAPGTPCFLLPASCCCLFTNEAVLRSP